MRGGARSGHEPLHFHAQPNILAISGRTDNEWRRGNFQSMLPPKVDVITKIRKDFAEAWIFDSFSTGESEKLVKM